MTSKSVTINAEDLPKMLQALDPVAAIDSIIAAQDSDPWEALVSAGITASDHLETGRWTIGDLALRVEKKYGSNSIEQWAKSIKVEVARVKEYRTVAGFWHREKSARAEILDAARNLYYSHFREAMRLEDMDEAEGFLRECADNDWTVEAARLELNKRLGKPEPPEKLVDVVAKVVEIDPANGAVMVLLGRDEAAALRLGDRYRIAIWEPGDVEEEA